MLRTLIATVGLVCLAACDDAAQPSKKKSGECASKPSPAGKPQTNAGLNIRGGDESGEDKFPFVGLLSSADTVPDQNGGLLGVVPVMSNLPSLPNGLPRPPLLGGGPGVLLGGPAGPEDAVPRSTCSASLVCPNVVLTAAHCFDSAQRPERHTFHIGAAPGAVPKDLDKAPRGVDVRILSKEGKTGRKDIALVKLDKEVDAKPATLIGREIDAPPKEKAVETIIVGFGNTETEEGQDVGKGTKRHAKMHFTRYFELEENKTFDGMGQLEPPEGLFVPASKTANACRGDSGGAALMDGRLFGVIAKILWFKNGILQPEVSCENSNVTAVVVVPKQLDWLKENLQEMCSSAPKFDAEFSPTLVAGSSLDGKPDGGGGSPDGQGAPSQGNAPENGDAVPSASECEN